MRNQHSIGKLLTWQIHMERKIHNGPEGSLIAELTSTPDKIKTFEESIKPFGILDSARTGVTAL